VSRTRRYLGAARILRAGDVIGPGEITADDPAEALARACREADVSPGVPHVYRVAERDGALVITGDVVISGQLAWQALELSRKSLPEG
jgi:hypothetical protein